jgi:YVTN family beta-propeller protein
MAASGCSGAARKAVVDARSFGGGSPRLTRTTPTVGGRANLVGRVALALATVSHVALLPVALALACAAPAAANNVYVTNTSSSDVSQYDVGAGGALALKSPATVPAGASAAPAGVAVSPDGESVYVADEFSGNVSQYDVGAAGALAPKSPATVPAGVDPLGVAVSPDGESVYVTNFGAQQDVPGTVSQYDVGAAGALAPKSPATVPAGVSSAGVAVSPDGESVYVTNFGNPPDERGNVSQYDVGAGGALAPKSPATVAAGNNPALLAVSPDGESVYVANTLASGVSDGVEHYDVSQYDVGAGGALVPKSTPRVPADTFPFAVAVSPDGHDVYVTNHGATPDVPGTVSQYDVGAGGALAPKSTPTVTAGNDPQWVAVSPDGESVYVANFASNDVSQYDVGAGGGLSPKSTAAVPAGDRPFGVAVLGPACAGSTATIVGTSQSDQLTGTSGADVFAAGAGNDTVVGRGGADLICATPGADVIEGGGGDDVVRAGTGDDKARGGGGDDELHGKGGEDTLLGGAGDDLHRGGGGDDRLSGGPGDDVHHGGGGDDVHHGGRGNDVHHGGRGNDTLRGGPGDDMHRGGAGEDDCRGGRGSDSRNHC